MAPGPLLLLRLQAPRATSPCWAGAGLGQGKGVQLGTASLAMQPNCLIHPTHKSFCPQPRRQSFLGWRSIHKAFPGCRGNWAAHAKLFKHRD